MKKVLLYSPFSKDSKNAYVYVFMIKMKLTQRGGGRTAYSQVIKIKAVTLYIIWMNSRGESRINQGERVDRGGGGRGAVIVNIKVVKIEAIRVHISRMNSRGESRINKGEIGD